MILFILLLSLSFSPLATLAAEPSSAERIAEMDRERTRLFPEGDRETAGYAVQSYELRGRFDWEKKALVAQVTIAIQPSETLSQVILDSRVRIDEVRRGDGTALGYQADEKGLLRIDLPAPTSAPLSIVVRYEASANRAPDGEPSALVAIDTRAGDPIPSRVVYTASEPLGVPTWMPCQNEPSARAKFSAELIMPSQESLIANGALVKNETTGGERRMQYATAYTLPPYLMGFSVGEFTTTTRYHGAVPISVWRRQGLPMDADAMLVEIDRQMSSFEKLLSPFPFEKYALVLLPAFQAIGIEHAGISFQTEVSSSESRIGGDLELTAHELAHQWFGDLMTVATWDDLWIKEGMATLLQEEAKRPYEDESGTHRLFGRDFNPEEGDAILDPALTPEEKYTSGPYDRAAWLITQIRSYVGESAFWGTLRAILQAHAFQAIDGEDFLNAFRPSLGDELVARAKAALPAKKLPRLVMGEIPGKLAFTLDDPDHAMLVPVEVRAYDASGAYRSEMVEPGESVSLPFGENDLLVLDSQDRHPSSLFRASRGKHLAPRTPRALEALLALGAGPQLAALEEGTEWPLDPAGFPALLHHVSSEKAKYEALQLGCAAAKTRPSPEWKAALTPALLAPPRLGLPRLDLQKGLSECEAVFPQSLWEDRWQELRLNPTDPSFTEAELGFLSLWALPAADALAVWQAVGAHGASVRARLIAWTALEKYLRGTAAFPSPVAEATSIWKHHFHELLLSEQTDEVLAVAFKGVVAAKDTEALPLLRELTRAFQPNHVQVGALCAAHALSEPSTQAWTDFMASLGETSALPLAVREHLAHPEKCDTKE